MAQTRSLAINNRPITAAQRRALIAAYHGNGRSAPAAARVVGVTPATAYLWTRRYEQDGERGLESRPHRRRATPKRIPEPVVEQICQQKIRDRSLTVRQIADRTGVGKSSVAMILRDARRSGRLHESEPTPHAPCVIRAAPVDREALLRAIETGLRLNFRSRSDDAAQVLLHRVWRPVLTRYGKHDRLDLFREPQLGRLLLRSGLQLGHSLMNTGDWHRAAWFLYRTRDIVLDIGAMRDRYENVGTEVSLRWDDILIECWEYLAIVLRTDDEKEALASARTAFVAIDRKHQPLEPTNRAEQLSKIHRSLAKLKMRRSQGRDPEIDPHLEASARLASDVRDLAWHAGTQSLLAELHHLRALAARSEDAGRYRDERDAMEIALEAMLAYTRELASPILRSNFLIDAVQLRIAHGMQSDISSRDVRDAADLAIHHGYGGQAYHLTALPGIAAWLPSATIESLRASARPT